MSKTLHITARRFKEFTLPGAPHRQIVPVASKERVPVGHRVWRNICRHARGGAEPAEACDRGTRR